MFRMAAIKAQIRPGQAAFASSSRETSFDIHANSSFSGALLMRLGFRVPPPPAAGKDIFTAGLEEVAAQDPDWMFVANYRAESIARKWQSEPLWQALKAVQAGHAVNVEPNLWARARGLIPARLMAAQVQKAVVGH